jgi:outer membrane protein assembly factor BamD (BamD/ComL family)
VLYLRAPDAAIFQIEAVAKPAAPPAGKPAIEEPPVEKPVGEKLPGGVPLAAAAIRPGELQAGEKTLRQASQEKAEVSRLYTQGLSAFWLDEWGQAIQSLEAVLKLQPDHVEAASRLETARRNLELDRLYREAQAAEVAGDWAAASAALEQLTGLSPSYQDAQARLAAARLQCQLVDLFAEARQLSQAGEWQAVVKIYDRIAELDPGAPDPDGLLANAQEQLAAQKKQAELEALYDRAVIALDAGRWEEAAGLLRQVLERQPGYAQSERLLARAEVELERQEAPIEIETIVAASAVPAAVAIADSTPVATVAVDTPEETLAPPAQEEAAAGPAGEWQAAARRAVRPALWMAAGWLLAGLAAIWLVGFSDRVSLIETLHTLYPGTTHEKIGYLLFILVSGPLSGLAVGIVLHRTALRLTKRQFLGLAAAWTVVGLLPAPFFIQGEITTAYIFTWFLAGALGGWATYAVLQRAGARLDRQARWAIILGWAIGLGIGTLLFRENSETIILLAFAVEGFIGGLATFTAWYRDGETKTRQVGTGPTLEAPVVEAETESPAPAPVATQIVGEPGASQTTEMIAGLPRAIRPALWLAAGWFLASLAALFFVYYTDLGGSLADWIYKSNIIDWNDAHYIPTVLVAGLLSGAAVGTVLGMAGLRPSRRQFLVLMGAWGLAYLFTALFIFGDFGRSVIVFSWFLAGALGGWVTYAVMRRAGARFDRQATLVIVLGWAVGLAFKEWLVEAIYFGTIYGLLEAANLSTFADNIGIPLFISLGHAVAGFIGGLATFAVWFSLEKAND